MALPIVTAVGNVVFEPEFKVGASGLSRCKLRIACNDRKKVNDEWVDGDTAFLDVILWRGVAEAASELRKGESVVVTGKLKVSTYETKDGGKGTSVEIEAQEIARTIKPVRNDSDVPF